MTTDPAVTAAAEAIMPGMCEWHGMEAYSECETCAYLRHARIADATGAVAAARPIIEAERDEHWRNDETIRELLAIHEAVVRERIAAEERAVKHYRVGPARCACGYDAYKVGGFFPDYHAMFMAHLDAAGRIARGQS